jgi:hypothetical protein
VSRRSWQASCHCGSIRIRFESTQPLRPRACGCGFCRRHGARSVSDPDGSVLLQLSAPPLVYRFASGSADYLLCATCGAYAGAASRMGGRDLITLNLNLFEDADAPEAEPVSYEGESAESKARRRAARWTPLIVEGEYDPGGDRGASGLIR